MSTNKEEKIWNLNQIIKQIGDIVYDVVVLTGEKNTCGNFHFLPVDSEDTYEKLQLKDELLSLIISDLNLRNLLITNSFTDNDYIYLEFNYESKNISLQLYISSSISREKFTWYFGDITRREYQLRTIFNYSDKKLEIDKEVDLTGKISRNEENIIGKIGNIDIYSMKIYNFEVEQLWHDDTIIFDSYQQYKQIYDTKYQRMNRGTIYYWNKDYTSLENPYYYSGYIYIVINTAYGGYRIPKKINQKIEELKKLGPARLPNDKEFKKKKVSCRGNHKHDDNDSDDYYYERTNPYFVQAVYESSLEDCMSEFCCLAVERIPNNMKFEITENDGKESIITSLY